jgi:hypothetical protein
VEWKWSIRASSRIKHAQPNCCSCARPSTPPLRPTTRPITLRPSASSERPPVVGRHQGSCRVPEQGRGIRTAKTIVPSRGRRCSTQENQIIPAQIRECSTSREIKCSRLWRLFRILISLSFLVFRIPQGARAARVACVT